MESLHRKNFNPKGQFMVCSEHFNEDCFKRLFHMEGNVKRVELFGEKLNYPQISRSAHRCRRKLRREGCCYCISFLNCVQVIFPVH